MQGRRLSWRVVLARMVCRGFPWVVHMFYPFLVPSTLSSPKSVNFFRKLHGSRFNFRLLFSAIIIISIKFPKINKQKKLYLYYKCIIKCLIKQVMKIIFTEKSIFPIKFGSPGIIEHNCEYWSKFRNIFYTVKHKSMLIFE